jgi:hypothetical protein
MLDINLIGGGFQHAYSSSGWNKSKYINWKKDNSADISFYIDEAIISGDYHDKRNFGWLLETPALNQNIRKTIVDNLYYYQSRFITIFTHDEHLLNLSDFFQFAPGGGSWIDKFEYSSKTKLCSSIISPKNYLEGHLLRTQEIENFGHFCDIYGANFTKLDKKEDALREYYFSVTFENTKCDSYFTEKIIDCFATQTIPIYYGSHNIKKYFNPDGIIFYYDSKNINFSNICIDFYYDNIHAVFENYEISKQFHIAEDWIYKNYDLRGYSHA